MLQEVQNHIENNVDPDVKAAKVLQNLNGKETDPEFNEAFMEIKP